MQTSEEILTMIAKKHGYKTWDELMFNTHPRFQMQYILEAMEQYANQFKSEDVDADGIVFCGKCGKMK